MECKINGINRKFIVLDAKYRACKIFGLKDKESSLTNYQAGMKQIPINSTDTALDDIHNQSQDTNTAKQNCDVWMSMATTSDGNVNTDCPAVRHCRNQTVNGIACNLPTITMLSRIFADREYLNNLDPTKNSYSTYNLSSWDFGGDAFGSSDPSHCIYSSTECTKYGVVYIYGLGSTSINKNYMNWTYSASIRQYQGGVIPVLDI